MSIKGDCFVWLPWQNFIVGNLCSNSREGRSFEAPAGKEDPMKRQQGQKTMQSFSIFSSGGHFVKPNRTIFRNFGARVYEKHSSEFFFLNRATGLGGVV